MPVISGEPRRSLDNTLFLRISSSTSFLKVLADACMKRHLWLILLCALLALIVGAVSLARHQAAFVIDECALVDRLPRIRPDYTGTVIPPNIAPLNFSVEEPGTYYRVKIYSARGKEMNVPSRSPTIVIPSGPW